MDFNPAAFTVMMPQRDVFHACLDSAFSNYLVHA